MVDAAILPEIQDLLDEVADKNHVTVAVFRATEQHGKTRARYEGSEVAKMVALSPALVRQDKLRALIGKKPIYLNEMYRRLGWDLVSITRNLRTNVGIDFVYTQLSSAAPTTQADYIALSNNTAATAATDSSSSVPWSSNQSADAAASGTTGEMTFGGMTRKQATPAHTGSATSYTLAATWTATGAVTAVQKAGLFGGSSRTAFLASSANNILFLENTFTSTTLATNDQISLTWTVNI